MCGEDEYYNFNLGQSAQTYMVFAISADDYNRLMNDNLEIADDEAVICFTKGMGSSKTNSFEELSVGDGGPCYKVKKVVDKFISNGTEALNVLPAIYIFVNNPSDIALQMMPVKNSQGSSIVSIQWFYQFDMTGDEAKKLAATNEINAALEQAYKSDSGFTEGMSNILIEGRAAERDNFYTMFGALLFLAIFLGFNGKAAAAISIIGGADGPTSIFLAGKLGQSALMGPIAVAAYSYMSLVPIIQPPVMKLLTTEKERKIKMEQLRSVSKLEKILFPIVITIVVCMILPSTAPLVGMLMLGNLFKESGVVKQLTETASNALMYIVVILLGTSVGASTSAEAFLNADTLKIVVLGLVAFAIGTFGGCMLGKLLCKLTHGKINPLIGSAGVSAVPMAARVSQKVGAEADPTNFLLMHAMGPNVAGVIGTAVAAGTFMAIFGV